MVSVVVEKFIIPNSEFIIVLRLLSIFYVLFSLVLFRLSGFGIWYFGIWYLIFVVQGVV